MGKTLKGCTLRQDQWVHDDCYEAVLRVTNSVIFEYYPDTGQETVSSLVKGLIAGDYNGRLMSAVMLEDGVIFPDDLQLSLDFQKRAAKGIAGEMELRLLTPANEYHWFRMSLTPHHRDGRYVILGVLTDVDAEMRQRQLLRYRAQYDAVSGIFNKSSFFVHTSRLLTREADHPHYLIRMDIDRFKLINELYSMAQGDAVLRYFGTILGELAKPGETYARFGSDVFCMCVSRTEQEVIDLIHEIENRANTYPITFKFVLSAGIVSIPRYEGESIDIICDHAAMAQKTVKGSYIHSWAFYDQSMSDSLNREHEIITSMEKGLKDGQFELYLQPKYDLNESKIVGAEALSRWNHPQDGLKMPNNYIPLFERNGFILRLDEYMWDFACRLLRKWIDEGHEPVPISVNVSRVHLYDKDLCSKLMGLVERYRIPPNLLELEITESAYIDCPEKLYEVIINLQKAGFSFSMDDFGKGYSSLHALKDIPVDVIKIDLSFLQEARLGKEIGRGILGGTIRMIKDIDLNITAEGVETAEQVEFLKKVGCTCAQGYYYAKPMNIESFERMMWS